MRGEGRGVLVGLPGAEVLFELEKPEPIEQSEPSEPLDWPRARACRVGLEYSLEGADDELQHGPIAPPAPGPAPLLSSKAGMQ